MSASPIRPTSPMWSQRVAGSRAPLMLLFRAAFVLLVCASARSLPGKHLCIGAWYRVIVLVYAGIVRNLNGLRITISVLSLLGGVPLAPYSRMTRLVQTVPAAGSFSGTRNEVVRSIESYSCAFEPSHRSLLCRRARSAAPSQDSS